MIRVSLALVAVLVLAAPHAADCADTGRAQQSEPPPLSTFERGPFDRYDPLGRWNRSIYRFNAGADKYVLLPGLRAYRMVVPRPLRAGFSNFLANLDQIRSLANSVLQLDAGKSARTLGRFVVNSTLGCAGLADPARYLGLTDYREDFGQTLGRWGVRPGPYLVLPIAGPSSVRDAVGWGVDLAFRSYLQSYVIDASLRDPGYVAWGAAQAVDARESEPFRYGEAGPFEYDLVRYLYSEYRAAEIAY